MKKLLLSLLLIACFVLGKAQWVTIPDTAFVSFLNSQGIGSCLNGNQLDTTCTSLVTCANLIAPNYTGVKSLYGIQYFDNINLIRFLKDSITNLPTLPTSLTNLELHNTKLTALPLIPNLNTLTCVGNPYLQFPSQLPPTLLVFNWIDNAHIDTIPLLPASLTLLFIDNLGAKHITSPLPPNLNTLSCRANDFTELPTLPGALQNLWCEDNSLTVLPAVDSVRSLHCGNNQLTSLPALCDSIWSLNVDRNQLSYLPSLPNSLMVLNVYINPLLSLSSLPSALRELSCSNTQIEVLPELPDSLYSLNILHTPNLHCLPQLKKITNFYWDSSAVHCLPSYPQTTNAYPTIANTPLCDVFNTNGCDVYYNITGELYNDDNTDCVKSITETNIQNLKVDLYQGGNLQQQGYFDNFYSFNTDYGTFQTSIDTTGLPFTVTCPANNIQTSVITALDSMDYSIDFALQCKPGFDLSAWSIASPNLFRPASTPLVHIKAGDCASFWGQRCNTTNLSGQLQITISGPASYYGPAAGALTPSTVTGNTITYTVADWSAINPETAFNIVMKVDTTALPGQSVCLNVSLTPAAGDNNPSNNSLSYCFSVVASLDPNNKTVYPTGSFISSDWLTYTVNFQNTGNSYAEHVYILDTLDSNLDESTFQLLSWSHENQTIVNGNVVRFNFPNINLPDSNANEPASHAYIQYKIKAKENLAPGAHIFNTAYIYFDFNAPVVTNTTDSRGCVPDTTMLTQIICSGDTFDFNGQLLTQQGNYSDTLQNQNGCDSIVSLTLVIDSLPLVNFYMSCSVSGVPANGCEWCAWLFPVYSNADSLVWHVNTGIIDTTISYLGEIGLNGLGTSMCGDTGVHVPVPIFQSFSVCLTAYSKCASVTYCRNVSVSAEGISETPLNNFQLYPNPAKDYVTIVAEQSAIGGELQVRDVTGRLVLSESVGAKQFTLNTSALAAGSYTVTIREKSGGIGVKRLVVK